ncbi:hypothetical protein SLA2020_313380 [Shorea laevis]
MRQNSNEARSSAEIGIPTNLAGSQDNLQARGDGKIYISCNSNHGKSATEVELVPDSLDAQGIQKMERHRMREAIGPSKMISPPEVEECWPINKNGPRLQVTNDMEDRISCREEADGHRESIGPICASHEKTNEGIPSVKDREEDSIEATQTEQRMEGISFVKDHEVDSSEATQAEQTIEGIPFENDHVEDTIEAMTAELHSDEQEIAFWKGFESESGQEREWMGRRQGNQKRNRKKKVRSCSSVYMGGRKEKQKPMPNERKRESKANRTGLLMPSFFPGPQNQVAGESVTDSGIENRNGSLRKDPEVCTAKRIWAFAKEIGAGDCGNEMEVIQKIKGMEDRDRKLIRLSKVSNIVVEGNGGTNL